MSESSAAAYDVGLQTQPTCPTPCDDDCDAPCHEGHQVTVKRSHVMDSCLHPDGPLVADWYRCNAVKPGNYGGTFLPVCALEVNHEGPHRARLVTTWRKALPAEFRPEFVDD